MVGQASDQAIRTSRAGIAARHRGVAAVAPYDTEGFSSPDWSGFQYDSAKRLRKPYPGLPGRWSGIRYDFVRGGAGLSIPGLPDEVTGCLDGT